MPYVHRRVKAGRTVEHRKFQSFRVHTKGVKRGPNRGTTSEKQARVNERVSEEHLRWDINANFDHRDLHAVLHYYAKDTAFAQVLKDREAFLKELRRLCEIRGVRYKYILVIETKRMTNPHLHLIISRMDPEIIYEAWQAVPVGGGGVSFQPMDRRGNHCKLAAYLMKESRSTMERYRKMGVRGKRYTKSQNMVKPEITYEVVPSSSWRKEPKPRQGATLYKFDDGAESRSGWHEASGYPYQEYFEIFDEKKPPGGRRARAGGGRMGGEKIVGYYRTCPNCGANLDPGERCDCREKRTARGVGSTQGGNTGKEDRNTVPIITERSGKSKDESR